MKPQIATTIEQSRRLLACGVDSETADMAWIDDTTPRLTIRTDILSDRYVVAPAWSLSALLELMPKRFKQSWPFFEFYLQLSRRPNGEWEIAYDRYIEANTPIEACVQMIEQVTNSLKKQKNNLVEIFKEKNSI